MSINFAFTNDPRRQRAAVAQRDAYASLYLAALGAAFKATSIRNADSSPEAVAKKVVERLTVELGMSISSCAKILKVTRPTVYSWIKEKQAPQSAQIDRLKRVHEAVSLIGNAFETHPNLDFKAELAEGVSVTSLLSADHIDMVRLEAALVALKDAPVVLFAGIDEDVLEAEGEVNQALLKYLRKAPM